MSLSNYATFQIPRPFSTSRAQDEQFENQTCDLITFLAVAQHLQVPILPITWQPNLELIGEGGMGRISQSLASMKTSFAFKRVQNHGSEDSDVFQSLISELMVLRHSAIRNHPNIVELQGICWDISKVSDPLGQDRGPIWDESDGDPAGDKQDLNSVAGDEKVWPVLIFEKSQYGDLYNFATVAAGRDLDFSARLKLCFDIANAVQAMHAKGIIHGDVKPQNVLVFGEGNTTGYTARVTDFGYSSVYSNENDTIFLAESWPWSAPEFNHRATPLQARKMDIFSFGLLCLWLLFEKQLSGSDTQPDAEAWMRAHMRDMRLPLSRRQVLEVLGKLKTKDKLFSLAKVLLSAQPDLDFDETTQLQRVFALSLAYNPSDRAENIEHFIAFLDPAKRRDGIDERFGQVTFVKVASSMNVQMESGPVKDKYDRGTSAHFPCSPHSQQDWIPVYRPSDCDFKLATSVIELYQSDYQVRTYIAKCLRERMFPGNTTKTDESTEEVAFQLSLCYEIGFGLPRDHEKAQSLVHRSGKTLRELQNTLKQLQNPLQYGDGGSLYQRLHEDGHLLGIDFGDYYHRHGRLEQAERALKTDIASLEQIDELRNSSLLISLLDILSKIISYQGRDEEATKVGLRVLQACTLLYGPENHNTLASMESLAQFHNHLAKWQAAEKLELEVVEINKRLLGPEHLTTLSSIGDLAQTYYYQGKLEEAEILEQQVLQTRTQMLGPEHPYTWDSMSHLASVYRDQGRWKDAEKLDSDVLASTLRVFGADHRDTLYSMSALASTYSRQEQWQKAEELQVQVMNTSVRVLGMEHPFTLNSMSCLGSTYRRQGRYQDAEKLEVEVMESNLRILGQDHVETWRSVGNLARTLYAQGWFQEAEGLLLQAVEMGTRLLGEDHPFTLESMHCQVLTLYSQRRFEEAEEMQTKVWEARSRIFGSEHPDTVESMEIMALILKHRGRAERGHAMMTLCLDISTRTWGPQHALTKHAQEALDAWAESVEDWHSVSTDTDNDDSSTERSSDGEETVYTGPLDVISRDARQERRDMVASMTKSQRNRRAIWAWRPKNTVDQAQGQLL